jgi:RNA polymerase sigma-70 factor (ECF subfamily)
MDVMNVVSETELLARVALKDQNAFSQIYDRFSGCLYSIAVRILRDETAAEDVMQEVFLQIWDRAATYNPELGKPLTWAVTMMRNRAVDRIRANARGQRLIEAATLEQESEPAFASASNEMVIGREMAQQVRAALASLPGDYRRVIEMAFFGGLTQSEIATALGAPLGTVKAQIRRGMLQMRETLAISMMEEKL